MFTMCAYTLSQAVTATPLPLTAIFDGYLTQSPASGNFLLPNPMRWLAGLGIGATITQAQFVTPSLREIATPQVQPLNIGAAPVNLQPITYYGMGGPIIPANNDCGFSTTNAAAGVERQFGLMWFGDGVRQPPPGEIITVRATASNTGAAFVWTASTFTFDSVLPGIRYAVVGMDVIGANLIAARLVFPNSTVRAGCLARQALATLPNEMFRNGNMGEYGRFNQTAPPGLEILPSAAGTTQTILLDLVPLG